MAYDKNNLARIDGFFAGAYNEWVYRSTDNFTTVKAANYLSNAFDMGVKAGDKITVIEVATPPVMTIATILTCTATACTMSQTGVVPST